MPNPSLTLWIDSSSSRLLSGWQSVSSATIPVLKQGDTIGVEVHWVSSFQGGSMSEVEFPPSAAMTLAIGAIDIAPTAGSFKLSYGPNETASLGFAATALQVQDALNALASITADGGVTVTKISTSYRVVFNVAKIPSYTLTVGSNELFPSSSIGVNNARTGTALIKQIYQIHIKQAPVANITSFVSQSPSAGNVAVIHQQAFSGDSSVWRVSIAPEPRDGTFLLTFSIGSGNYMTFPISIDATAAEIVSALTLVANFVSWGCIKTGRFSWDISTSNSSVAGMDINDGGIISFNSKYGVLSLNTAEVEDLLAGRTSVTTSMELEIFADNTRQTLFQTNVNILNDLIDNDSYTTVQWGELMPADSVVRFDTSQSLNANERLQARTNIGAVGTSDISGLSTTDTLLEARIAQLEVSSFTQDQVDGILGGSPSATDFLVNQSTLDGLLDGKAPLIHEHLISDVDNLQQSLDAKTPFGHTHSISDIINFSAGDYVTEVAFNTALGFKSDTGHTHTILDVLYVGALTVPSVSFTDGTEISTAPVAFADAPSNGEYYLRKDGSWVLATIVVETINGTQYNIVTV